MQPSDTAFDRVKSLLGKMDRSIDDARRRRLHDPEDEPADQRAQQGQTTTDQTAQSAPDGPADSESSPTQAPDRPASKYGRARPLRELPTQNGPNWQTA